MRGAAGLILAFLLLAPGVGVSYGEGSMFLGAAKSVLCLADEAANMADAHGGWRGWEEWLASETLQRRW